MLRSFFILCILFSCSLATAQLHIPSGKYDHYTVENGLSNNLVSCIKQDRHGFIWIGTFNGLNRFDGYEFVNYSSLPGDSTSISNNFINDLFIDSNDYIWITTKNGLNRFDPKTETFKQYLHQPGNSKSISSNQVQGVAEDKDGNIWTGAFQTLEKLNPSTGEFTHYKMNDLATLEDLNFIKELILYDEDLFISMWGIGVYRLNTQSSKFTFLPKLENKKIVQTWPHDFLIDSQKNLLMIDGQINSYIKNENAFRKMNVHDLDETDDNYTLTCVKEMPGQKYITGSMGDGFYLYNDQFIKEAQAFLVKNKRLKSYDHVQTLYVSNNGMVWLGTFNGLFKWDTHQKAFHSFENEPGNNNSISPGSISGTYCDSNGDVLIGTNRNAVNIYHPATNSFDIIKPANKGLNSRFVNTVYIDRQHNKWIGTWGQGLNRIDAITGAFTYFKKGGDSGSSLNDDFVTAITQGHDNKIWVTTTKGVSVISYENDKASIKSFSYEPGSKNCPGALRTDDVFCDPTGNVWIGTDVGGLNKYIPSENKFELYNYDFNDTNSLSGNGVTFIFGDSKNQLWVACHGGGLNLYQPIKNNFIHFTKKNGLPSNEVRSMVEDKNGNYWITTDKGLCFFNPSKNIINTYVQQDGLLSSQFMTRSISINPVDGKIYAGTPEGMVAFHPDSILHNTVEPRIYFNAFKKYITSGRQDVSAHVKAIQYSNEITLNHFENSFAVSFVAINYSNTEKNQYAYKLEGLNKNWINIGTTRELTFSNLQPGSYQLHIKASNNDLVWNETGATLSILILPPWWKTWWAYLLYALALLTLVLIFIRIRINQGINKVKAIQAVRTKISSDLHDDVGTILSGLAMQSQVLTYSAREEQKQPLTDISNMSRDAMEHMRDIVWAMDSRKDKYENLVDRMRDFAEKNLSLKKITHEFIITEIAMQRFINPEKRQNIYLIFKEAITNIVKHSNATHTVIRFAYQDYKLMLSVHDNGTEPSISASGGLGLSNMKMRAGKIGGQLLTVYENGFLIQLTV